jgi:hypothetical protein
MSFPLPRPALLAIVGLLLACSAFLVMRRERTAEEPGSASPAAVAPAAPKAPAGRAESPGTGGPKRSPAKDAGAELGLPDPVARALARRKVVVLFFSQRGPADDVATRLSVRSLHGRRVAVFSDTLEHLSHYSRLVSGVGISRAPAVVIIDGKRRARLIEGFVDRDSLEQAVVDAGG